MPLSNALKPDPSAKVKSALEDNNSTEAKATEVLQKLCADPSLRSVISKVLVNSGSSKPEPKKPDKWSTLSNAPYYREKYALELKCVLDRMMIDGDDRDFLYKDFQPALSPRSLYARVNQSKKYLLENLDPEHTYRNLLERISITREDESIRISFVRESLDLKAEIVKPDAPQKIYTWRDELEEWLEHSKIGDKPFHQKGLALSDEEQFELENDLGQLKNILYSITENAVKVIKIEPEEPF